MSRFGRRSMQNLASCDQRLQLLAHRVLPWMNISVLEGYRDPRKQLEHYKAGRSKVKFGKHNVYPSRAVHFAPYPYQEKDLRPYYYLGGLVRAIADELGFDIRWGGDWDSDGDIFDQSFNDLMHFELEDEDGGNTR